MSNLSHCAIVCEEVARGGNLDLLCGLECLKISECVLYRLDVSSLANLRRLVLSNCEFSLLPSDSMRAPLVNLVEFVLDSPRNSSHITLEALNRLKWFEISLNAANSIPRFHTISSSLVVLDLKFPSPGLVGKSKRLADLGAFIRRFEFAHLECFSAMIRDEIECFDLGWLSATMQKLKVINLSRANIRSIKFEGEKSFFGLESLSLHPSLFNSSRDLISKKLTNLKRLVFEHKEGRVETELESESFPGLLGLEELVLRGFKLARIDKNCFLGLNNLKILDLGSNELSGIDPEIFRPTSGLTELSLKGNRIEFVESSAFTHLDRLISLDLSDNSIGRIEKGAFSRLESLERLDLSQHRLETVTRDMFDGLARLRVLNLDSNSPFRMETDSLLHVTSLDNVSLFGLIN